MKTVRLGLDVGTTSVKAAIYNTDGQLLELEEAAAPDVTGHSGQSEQDMGAVWEIVCSVLTKVSAKLHGMKPVSLGIGAQGDGLWAIDKDGTPAGPAMLWSDTRAADDMAHLIESGATSAVSKACHTSLWPGTSGMLWRWLGKNDPQSKAKIDRVFTCGDWIGWNLTGEAATDYSNASIPFLDLMDRRYSESALAAMGCEDLQEKLAEPRAATSLLGHLSAKAAGKTGLPEGLPIAVPTLDLAAMIVGMGMDKPGQTMMIMGTTAVVNILTDKIVPCDLPVGASALHATSDAIIRILAPTTGAAAFDWFAELHPLSLGGDTPGEVAAKLNELVTQVPPGSNGLTFLPYLNGERAPFVSPDIAAAFHGLRSKSTKADMGRAVLEGGAMSLRHCFEMEGELPTMPVQLTGGGSKNTVWCQIIADVIGAPVVVSDASDQGLWGAACIGASAAGFGDVMTLVARTEKTRRYEPDIQSHRAYSAVYARYKLLSDNARSLAEALKKLGESA